MRRREKETFTFKSSFLVVTLYWLSYFTLPQATYPLLEHSCSRVRYRLDNLYVSALLPFDICNVKHKTTTFLINPILQSITPNKKSDMNCK